MIIGGCGVDITSTLSSRETHFNSSGYPATSYPATTTRTLGGVGANMAIAATRLGAKSFFLSCVGADADGDWVISELIRQGIQIYNQERPLIFRSNSLPTASYNAIHDHKGDLIMAAADMRVQEGTQLLQQLPHLLPRIKPAVICSDGNVHVDSINFIIDYCCLNQVAFVFEPTSVAKSCKIFNERFKDLKAIDSWITPNHYELQEMANYIKTNYPETRQRYISDQTKGKLWLLYIL